MTSVVIGTECIGSCKSNYHTITAKMAPVINLKDKHCKIYQLVMFHIHYLKPYELSSNRGRNMEDNSIIISSSVHDMNISLPLK